MFLENQCLPSQNDLKPLNESFNFFLATLKGTVFLYAIYCLSLEENLFFFM